MAILSLFSFNKRKKGHMIEIIKGETTRHMKCIFQDALQITNKIK